VKPALPLRRRDTRRLSRPRSTLSVPSGNLRHHAVLSPSPRRRFRAQPEAPALPLLFVRSCRSISPFTVSLRPRLLLYSERLQYNCSTTPTSTPPDTRSICPLFLAHVGAYSADGELTRIASRSSRHPLSRLNSRAQSPVRPPTQSAPRPQVKNSPAPRCGPPMLIRRCSAFPASRGRRP